MTQVEMLVKRRVRVKVLRLLTMWVLLAASTLAAPVAWASGGRIVFTSRRLTQNDLYVMNADGTSQTRLTFGAAWHPDVSPDGTKIVFMSDVDGDLYLINTDGTGLTRLTNTTYIHEGPSFSPDGNQIVFKAYIRPLAKVC